MIPGRQTIPARQSVWNHPFIYAIVMQLFVFFYVFFFSCLSWSADIQIICYTLLCFVLMKG